MFLHRVTAEFCVDNSRGGGAVHATGCPIREAFWEIKLDLLMDLPLISYRTFYNIHVGGTLSLYAYLAPPVGGSRLRL